MCLVTSVTYMPASLFKYCLRCYNGAVWYCGQGYASKSCRGGERSGSRCDGLLETGQTRKCFTVLFHLYLKALPTRLVL